MTSMKPDRVMHALRLHGRAGADHLVYEDAPLPFVGIGDVLLRVHAASFTPTELTWLSTWVDRRGEDRRPIILAHEVSGIVTALGEGTTGASLGEALYGLTDWYRDGAAADYIAVEGRNLAPIPTSMSHVTAAAIPMAGLTAWQALFDHGHLQAGQTVLIHGAGGGVGTAAVQLAHGAGARVLATGHALSRQLVTKLGADAFIDVDRERFEEAVAGVDLVFDLVGGDVLQRSWSVVKPGGVIVSVVETLRPETHARSQAQSRGPRQGRAEDHRRSGVVISHRQRARAKSSEPKESKPLEARRTTGTSELRAWQWQPLW